MHDHHIALTASTFGHIGYIPEQLAQYRIHSSNVVAGKSISYKKPSVKDLFTTQGRCSLQAYKDMANEKRLARSETINAFIETYAEDIPTDKRKLLDTFIKSASSQSSFYRKANMLKNKMMPHSTSARAVYLTLGT